MCCTFTAHFLQFFSIFGNPCNEVKVGGELYQFEMESKEDGVGSLGWVIFFQSRVNNCAAKMK